MGSWREIREGALFAVPLPPSGWCVMAVCAKGRAPFLQGRFFLRHFAEIPSLDEAKRTVAHAPGLTFIHGPMGIERGEWKELGSLDGYKRDAWVETEFYNSYMDSVALLDPKTLRTIGYRRIRDPGDRELPRDGAAGDVYCAEVVADVLAKTGG